MKNKILILPLLVSLSYMSCEEVHEQFQVQDDFVKLNASISDTAETIRLGDTLKIKLSLPDVLVTSKNTITVNSLQEGWYLFNFSFIDTVLKRGVTLNTTAAFVTGGGWLSSNGAAVYLSNGSKPFTATLNLVPPQKGVYKLHIEAGPSKLRVNNTSSPIGLRVNFAVAEKHWNMLAYYYNTYFNTSISEFLSVAQQEYSEGYGLYGFRVN